MFDVFYDISICDIIWFFVDSIFFNPFAISSWYINEIDMNYTLYYLLTFVHKVNRLFDYVHVFLT